MKINARLKEIGDLVPPSSVVLDVGCDHALLDIYLIYRNKDIKPIASDIAEGPLKQASMNIHNAGMDDLIELRKGPGLSTYTPDINTLIISGMGGLNIIGICKEYKKELNKIDTLILSPNNYQETLKRYLTKHKFYIDNEVFVKDKKFIYQIIIFKKGKKKYTNKEYFFGPIFLQKKGPLFREYYTKELQSRKILLSLLPSKYKIKRHKINKEIKLIKNEIED